MARGYGGDGQGASGAALKSQQQVGLVLQLEVDGGPTVHLLLTRRPRALPRAATPYPPTLMGGELRRHRDDPSAGDELGQVEPVHAVIHQRVGGPNRAGAEVPLVLVGSEHILRQVDAANASQPTEPAGGNIAAQGAQQRIAPVAIGDGPYPPSRGS